MFVTPALSRYNISYVKLTLTLHMTKMPLDNIYNIIE